MIDIAVNESITLYYSKDNNIVDWNHYIKLHSIKDEEILFKDDMNLLLYNSKIELDKYILEDSYDSFIRVGDICILSSRDILNNKFKTLGLSYRGVESHSDFMLGFIYKILLLISDNKIDIAINTIKDLYEKYINLELLPGYYREFNFQSKYKISAMNYLYYADLKDPDVLSLDTTYNERVIRYIYSLLWGLYKKV